MSEQVKCPKCDEPVLHVTDHTDYKARRVRREYVHVIKKGKREDGKSKSHTVLLRQIVDQEVPEVSQL